MQTGNIDFIYKNKLNKACFQYDMAYGKAKDLVRRTQSDKVLRDKAFNIASDPKYDGYQRGLASMIYKFFDKKSSGGGITNERKYQLADKLHKPIIITKSIFIHHSETIFDEGGARVDLADMQSLSKYNKGIKYLLCTIDLFSKYAWVIPMKDKKNASIFFFLWK